MAADPEVRMRLQRLARSVDQRPSPRNPHGEHPSSHFADANNRMNCEQLQPTGAFAAIASKTRSDYERLIWRLLDVVGWTVTSISGARIFLLLPFVCCLRNGDRVPRPSRVHAMWRCLPPDSERTGKYLPISEVGHGVVVADVDVFVSRKIAALN